MSGKDSSDPEKDMIAADNDVDVEKQAQDPIESKDSAIPEEPERDPNIVEFDGPHDPDNPKNWNPRRKMTITASLGSMAFVVTFSSSIFAVCLGPVSAEYNVGTVVAALGVCLFLLVSKPILLTRMFD